MIEQVKKKSLFDVFVESAKCQPIFYRRLLPIILLIVMVKDWYLYFGGMPTHSIAYYSVAVVMTLLLIYLFASFIYGTSLLRAAESFSIKRLLIATAGRLLSIYLICLFIIAYCVGFYFLGKHLAAHWAGVQAKPSTHYLLIIMLFTVFPTLYGVVVLMYAPVLALLKRYHFLHAIRESVLLSWFHWFYVFSLYVFVGFLYVLLAPTSLHAHFFIHYHVMIVFDFIVLALLLPIFSNMVLTILSELERMER